MEPKKSRYFTKKAAEKLDLTESLVEDVASFYWSGVRRALNNTESSSIVVTNLGSFMIKPTVLPKKIQKYTDILNNITPENITFHKHHIYQETSNRLKRLLKIQEEIESEKLRKEQVKKKRKAYVSNKNLEREG